MTGGHVAKFKQLFRLRLILALLLNGIILVAVAMALDLYTSFDSIVTLGILGATAILVATIQGYILSAELTKPTEYLAQAIFHISPNEHLVEAPVIDKLRFGRELVATLTRQIYDYAASSQSSAPSTNGSVVNSNNLIDSMPVGVIGLDEKNNIVLINSNASSTLGLHDCVGLSLKSQIQMSFPEKSLEEWFIEVKSKTINASNSWSKIEVSTNNGTIRTYCDIAATFQQQSASGIEKLIVLFDHGDQFAEEEDTLSLIALSVHEIRTPLTILRGYIEVLHDELEGKLDAESKLYIDRLSAASENLASFMANVLSVVKADQNQLSLQLQETSWPEFLKSSVEGLGTRVKVRNKQIKLTIAENIPTVALEPVSINEVLTNLVDNAIKYSPEDKNTIWIDSKLNSDGSVLTTVKDEGVGIPESVVPNLFTRFYRNRRNRAEIAGTGLGLYISKEIVSAHHGNIWLNSKEGQGTAVSFTLIPYTRLADVEKTSDNNFSQVQHGWIKNHNMQRR